jgi:hypothetical protein
VGGKMTNSEIEKAFEEWLKSIDQSIFSYVDEKDFLIVFLAGISWMQEKENKKCPSCKNFEVKDCKMYCRKSFVTEFERTCRFWDSKESEI